MYKQIGILVLMFTALVGRADITTNLSVNTPVPDGNPSGMASTLNISGVFGSVSNVQVNLNITGGFNGDLYAYLLSPQGSLVVLLNRVGIGSGNSAGYANTGFNITLAAGGANIHNYQSGSYSLNGSGQLINSWAPDQRTIDPQSVATAFNTAPAGTALADLIGQTPDGNWTLFVADLSGGGQSTLVSWGLTVVTVPEPQTWALLGGGLATFWTLARRRK
jgi:subtilisin-like proprotein convertase family protein